MLEAPCFRDRVLLGMMVPARLTFGARLRPQPSRKTAVKSTARVDTTSGRCRARKLRYHCRRRALVRAAFLAAAERRDEPLVFAASRAAAERAEAERCEAARRDCFDSAARDTVLRGSRLSTRNTARETLGRRRVFRLPWPASYAYSALLRVRALALPFRGGRSGTPARRASDRPIAIACCGDLAPCRPRRILRTSSRTNSPAWVIGDLPARLSRLAFCTVLRSGMIGSFVVTRPAPFRFLTHDRGKWSAKSKGHCPALRDLSRREHRA